MRSRHAARDMGRPSGVFADPSFRLLTVAIVIVSSLASGCRREPALYQLAEAQRRSADLVVQFTKANDAANRAVMADTDEASVAFAREAEQASQAVQHDAETQRRSFKDAQESADPRSP